MAEPDWKMNGEMMAELLSAEIKDTFKFMEQFGGELEKTEHGRILANQQVIMIALRRMLRIQAQTDAQWKTWED